MIFAPWLPNASYEALLGIHLSLALALLSLVAMGLRAAERVNGSSLRWHALASTLVDAGIMLVAALLLLALAE